MSAGSDDLAEHVVVTLGASLPLASAEFAADALLPAALKMAEKRVVVKRPDYAGWLNEHKPSMAIETKSNRFDVYVMAALAQIDEVFRAPLVLFYLEEHSYQEIAEILGISVGTVKSRVNRARRELESILERRQLAHRERTAVSASGAFDAIMAETADMQRPRARAQAAD